MSQKIAPSVLSANFGNLAQDIQMLNHSEADWIHIDVMDGVFVPNISFGFPVLKFIKSVSTKPLDVHLMITNPDPYLEEFKKYGADLLSVHYETCHNLHRTVHAIKDLGMKAGVVLNPHSSVQLLEDIIQDLDFVLLMSVNPGYGGQKFIHHTFTKIAKLKDLIQKTHSHALIEIDGGVNLENAPKLFEAGADVLVAGNAVFASEDPAHTIRELKSTHLK